MANLINEAKRMQHLAGIINESQILSEAVKLDVLMKDGKPNSEILVVPNKSYSNKEELDANTMRPFQIKKEEGRKDMMVFTVVGRKAENQQFPIEGDEVADIILYNDAKSKLKESELNEDNTNGGIKKTQQGNDYSLEVSADYWSGGKGQGDHVIAFKKGNTFYVNFNGSWNWKTEPKSNELKNLLKKYVEENNIENISPESSKFLGLQSQAESLDIDSVVNEALKSIKEVTPNAPADVAALGKAQSTASTVASKAKAINSINEFPGAFENWFKTLGFQPGKVSKSAVRSAVEKVLTNLGYK